MDDLLRAWRALVTPYAATGEAEQTGRALLACWAEPHRRYHDLDHLRAVLAAIDELEHLAADPTAVRLAAWYHDSVYAGRADDEERSARKAEVELSALSMDSALVVEVARLVRMTVEHNPGAGDSNAEVLSDADLAALGVNPATYQQNSAAIRQEYLHVPDAEFRAGRAKVIDTLLNEPRLFRTAAARERWEDTARANLRAELATLGR